MNPIYMIFFVAISKYSINDHNITNGEDNDTAVDDDCIIVNDKDDSIADDDDYNIDNDDAGSELGRG
jgi:hypothetical protein